jgi:hypothetical protein
MTSGKGYHQKGWKTTPGITTVGKRAEEILTGTFTGINHHAIKGVTTRGLSLLKGTSIITMRAETVTPMGATTSLLLW